jgi:hypothetical protein
VGYGNGKNAGDVDLWNRQEAVSVDLTKRSEDQRHEAVNQQEYRIREDRRGTIVKEKETPRPA